MGDMKIYKTMLRGQVRWAADAGRVNGKRRRRLFATKQLAKAELDAIDLQRKTAGDVWVGLSPSERLEAAQIIVEFRARGLTLRTVWDRFLDSASVAPPEPVALGKAFERFLEAKRGNGNRASYLESLNCCLKRFVDGRSELPVHKVTLDDVSSFLDAVTNRNTKRSRHRRLGAFLSFCAKRGWIRENPAARIDSVRIEQTPPRILTVRQSARVLVWTRRHKPDCLAWAALCLLAGVRPHEALKLKWADVNLDEGVLVIDAAASKVALRRIVHLEPAAVGWMKLAKQQDASLPAKRAAVKRLRQRLARHLGFPSWPADILRHTAASYLLASKRDAGAVALELGHSVGILFRHYRELVSRKDAARFWRLMPRAERKAARG